MIGSRSFALRWRTTALGVALGVAGLLALSLAASALAAGEFEHNDTRETAFGPLEGGKSYTATFETDNDVDWYVFYIKTYSQMDFSATLVKSGGVSSISLYDKDGKYVDDFDSGYVNETNHLLLTMNPGRYYLEAERQYGYTGGRYSFRIDPAASITSSRDCGEAIVARDAVGPELAVVNEELAKNGEALARKSQAVRKAKKVLRRLKGRRWASRWEKQQAVRRLQRAKEARDKVLQARANLQSIAAQQQQALTGAEGQIATYC